MMLPPPDRRLIEDYLPLDELNAIAGKEKKHPKHPVALVHYWSARRPTTASRAAIYAELVPAPNSDGERTESTSFVTNLAAFKLDPNILSKVRERIRTQHGRRAPNDVAKTISKYLLDVENPLSKRLIHALTNQIQPSDAVGGKKRRSTHGLLHRPRQQET